MSSTYIEKLRDPHWQKKRLEVMSRDGFTCQLCGDTEHTLNVHHRRYILGRDPWDYPDEDLITLCEACHSLETEFAQARSQILNDQFVSGGFFNGDAPIVASAIGKHCLKQGPSVNASIIQFALTSPDICEMLTRLYLESHIPEEKLLGSSNG